MSNQSPNSKTGIEDSLNKIWRFNTFVDSEPDKIESLIDYALSRSPVYGCVNIVCILISNCSRQIIYRSEDRWRAFSYSGINSTFFKIKIQWSVPACNNILLCVCIVTLSLIYLLIGFYSSNVFIYSFTYFPLVLVV